jgi:arylsulfatase
MRLFLRGSPLANAGPVLFDVYAVRTPELKHPYNIVVITIDTLRADRLGCYGYKRPTSPNLDAFAKEAVLFKNAFSTSSFTPPAHASLFTSKYVADHGLLTWNKLPDGEVTLAEVLQDCGYMTAASISRTMLSRQNLGQGFDLWKEGDVRDGREVVQDGLQILRSPSNRPLFLWLHLFDVHRPYGREPGWAKRFNAGGRAGVGDNEKDYNLASKEYRKLGNGLEGSGLSEADLQFIADRYDAGVAYADSVLGPLLTELSKSPRLEDTLVVVTSDHGENLLEHRECLFSHDPFLYSVVTRIPLLIRYPKAADGGKTVESLVSLIDIAPTVMDAIGLDVPPSFKTGRSIEPLRMEDEEWRKRKVYMECWGWEKLKAVRSQKHLILTDMKTGKAEYYELTNDPGELQPFPTPQSECDSRIAGLLSEFSKRKNANAEAPKLDSDLEQQLRSLGYVH